MEVKNNLVGDVLNVSVTGRIDTTTAPEFENSIRADMDNATKIVLDMNGVEYISSAGLRALLTIQKTMTAKKGTFEIKNVSDDVMEVFEMTGFSSFLTII